MDRNVRTALIIGGVIAAALVLLSVLPGLLGWQGYGHGMMGGFGWGGPVFMIVFWGLVIWGIVALVGGASACNAGTPPQADSALEILKRRYARGEITREQYEEKKKDLM